MDKIAVWLNISRYRPEPWNTEYLFVVYWVFLSVTRCFLNQIECILTNFNTDILKEIKAFLLLSLDLYFDEQQNL